MPLTRADSMLALTPMNQEPPTTVPPTWSFSPRLHPLLNFPLSTQHPEVEDTEEDEVAADMEVVDMAVADTVADAAVTAVTAVTEAAAVSEAVLEEPAEASEDITEAEAALAEEDSEVDSEEDMAADSEAVVSAEESQFRASRFTTPEAVDTGAREEPVEDLEDTTEEEVVVGDVMAVDLVALVDSVALVVLVGMEGPAALGVQGASVSTAEALVAAVEDGSGDRQHRSCA